MKYGQQLLTLHLITQPVASKTSTEKQIETSAALQILIKPHTASSNKKKSPHNR